MATRQFTNTTRGASSGGRDVIIRYTGMLNGDDGAWYSQPGMVLRAYSVQGVLGAGGSVSLKISCNDATSPAFVPGAQADESGFGAAVSTPQTVMGSTYSAATSYRPICTAGDVTTNLTVTLYFIQD